MPDYPGHFRVLDSRANTISGNRIAVLLSKVEPVLLSYQHLIGIGGNSVRIKKPVQEGRRKVKVVERRVSPPFQFGVLFLSISQTQVDYGNNRQHKQSHPDKHKHSFFHAGRLEIEVKKYRTRGYHREMHRDAKQQERAR